MKGLPVQLIAGQVYVLKARDLYEHFFCRYGRFECEVACPKFEITKMRWKIVYRCAETGEIIGHMTK